MLNYESPEILNVGTGEDLMIRELAGIIAQVTGFQGQLVFDDSKPDGTPRKVLDVSRIHALGWKAQMTLEHGIAATYQWYLSRQAQTVAP
jgi:GDP-L-fucose synthase